MSCAAVVYDRCHAGLRPRSWQLTVALQDGSVPWHIYSLANSLTHIRCLLWPLGISHRRKSPFIPFQSITRSFCSNWWASKWQKNLKWPVIMDSLQVQACKWNSVPPFFFLWVALFSPNEAGRLTRRRKIEAFSEHSRWINYVWQNKASLF